MALELRPNCEYCDKDLPPGSARGAHLHLRVHVLRRLRRERARRRLPQLRRRLRGTADPAGDGVASWPLARKRPASAKRVHLSYSREDVAAHSARIRDIPPAER